MTSPDTTRNTATLCLPARMDTDCADQLREDLIQHRGAPLTLDGTNVIFVGARCLGMLISAAKTWGTDGHDLRIDNPSEDLTRDLGRMGADLDLISASGVTA